MNTPWASTHAEADFRSTVPFSRSGMRLSNGLGCSVSLLNTSHVTPKSDVRRGVHRVWNCVPPLMVLELVLEIGAPREARWRCLSTSDGASWLDCASHFDVTSFDVNILAPFGADSRISRTARRMAQNLLCAALLLLGCLRPVRAARLAIAALGICRASYLDLLLDAASSFSSTAARACLSSQHTARERTRPIPSRARHVVYLC